MTDASLVETLRLEEGTLVRLERHLARMGRAAHQLGRTWPEGAVRDALDVVRAAHTTGVWRLRLSLAADSPPVIECTSYEGTTPPWRVAFAGAPVDAQDPRLYLKTTARAPYEAARRSRPDVDEVLLWNEEGEVTEFTIGNLVAEIDGVRCTPPVRCGLLAGVLRAELLEKGEAQERVLTRGMVARAPRLWLVNSLRGWVETVLVR